MKFYIIFYIIFEKQEEESGSLFKRLSDSPNFAAASPANGCPNLPACNFFQSHMTNPAIVFSNYFVKKSYCNIDQKSGIIVLDMFQPGGAVCIMVVRRTIKRYEWDSGTVSVCREREDSAETVEEDNMAVKTTGNPQREE